VEVNMGTDDKSPAGRTHSEPALQNIPLRTDLGREIAKSLIKQEGFVSIDYALIENRFWSQMESAKEDARARVERTRGLAKKHGVTLIEVHDEMIVDGPPESVTAFMAEWQEDK
jgi:hypothetical protein